MRTINEHRERIGREGRTTLTMSSGTDPRPDLRRYSDAGADRLIMRPYQRSRSALADIQRYGEDILRPFTAER
jgi:hypothetical protein